MKKLKIKDNVDLKEWKNRSVSPFEKQTKNHIRKYWFDDNFNQPFCKKE